MSTVGRAARRSCAGARSSSPEAHCKPTVAKGGRDEAIDRPSLIPALSFRLCLRVVSHVSLECDAQCLTREEGGE